MRKSIMIVSVIIVLAALIYYFQPEKQDKSEKEIYQFSKAEKGDIENIVSSTGTLDPVSTVSVGTQVSGRIAKIFVDFNDQIKKGKLLAVLDTTNLAEQVIEAESKIISAKAQLEKSDYNYKQMKELWDKGMISELEFLNVKTEKEGSRASYLSAEAALRRAKQNLDYAYIYAPIDGIIIDRQVEEGQTVAASMQAPVLFTVANDLTEMEMLAQVDESDIGLIQEGQAVRFEVPAYPGKQFFGVIKQVRLQPNVVQNVVTYSVAISAANKDKLLLPGMTAMVDFIIERAENVLKVPVNSVNIKPNDEMIAILKEKRSLRKENDKPGDRPQSTDNVEKKRDRMERSLLWFKDEDGKLNTAWVKKGLSDGKFIEIKEASVDLENKEILIHVANGREWTGNNQNGRSSNPLAPPMGRRR